MVRGGGRGWCSRGGCGARFAVVGCRVQFALFSTRRYPGLTAFGLLTENCRRKLAGNSSIGHVKQIEHLVMLEIFSNFNAGNCEASVSRDDTQIIASSFPYTLDCIALVALLVCILNSRYKQLPQGSRQVWSERKAPILARVAFFLNIPTR